MYQNYPNPFNPETRIKFQIRPPIDPLPGDWNDPIAKKGIPVLLKIYNVIGKETATLVNEQLKPGSYQVEWDASNYPSGVYFYRLMTESFSETKKMILVK